MAGVPTLVAEPDTRFELTVVDLDPLRAAISAAGEFDLAATESLAEVLQQQEDACRRIVRIDLSKVTFLDCSCLAILFASHHRFLELHGLLVLTGVDERLTRILKITGLDASLFIVPIGEDPFDSVLMSRVAPRRVPNQPPPDLTRFETFMAVAGEPGPRDERTPQRQPRQLPVPTPVGDPVGAKPAHRKAVS